LGHLLQRILLDSAHDQRYPAISAPYCNAISAISGDQRRSAAISAISGDQRRSARSAAISAPAGISAISAPRGRPAGK